MKIFKKKTFDSIYEIEYAKNFLLENNLKSVILLSESGFTEQIIIGLSKKFPINIILLQHGISVFKPSSLNYNKILGGIIPLDSNYFFRLFCNFHCALKWAIWVTFQKLARSRNALIS